MSLSQNSRRRRRLVQGQGGVDLGLRRWKALTVGTAKRAKEWEEGSKRILAYCLSTNRVCRGRWRDTWSGVLQRFGDEVVAHDMLDVGFALLENSCPARLSLCQGQSCAAGASRTSWHNPPPGHLQRTNRGKTSILSLIHGRRQTSLQTTKRRNPHLNRNRMATKPRETISRWPSSASMEGTQHVSEGWLEATVLQGLCCSHLPQEPG
jgi:hypothetical protein